MSDIDPNVKAAWIVEAALEMKSERPVVLDMRKLTSYADTFVILTGRSDRQVRSIADELAGNHEAARRIELDLPETGVCTSQPQTSVSDAVLAVGSACCGPEADEDAGPCCGPEAEAIGSEPCCTRPVVQRARSSVRSTRRSTLAAPIGSGGDACLAAAAPTTAPDATTPIEIQKAGLKPGQRRSS